MEVGKIVKIPIFLPKLNNKGILPFFADVVKRKTIETEPRYYLLKFRRRHAVTLYVSVVIKNVFKKIPKVPIRLYKISKTTRSLQDSKKIPKVPIRLYKLVDTKKKSEKICQRNTIISVVI